MIDRRRLLGMSAAALGSGCVRSGGKSQLIMQSSYINDAEFLGYFIAMEKGFYRDEGVDFVYKPGGPDIIPESALLSGKADVALTDIDTTISAINRQGAGFKIIGAQFQNNPTCVISLSERPIRTLGELAGKRVSVSPVSMAVFQTLIRLNGLPPGSVHIVPDLQSDPTALLVGTVDAALGFVSDYPFVISQHGKTPVSFLLDDYGLPQFIDTVVVSEDTLRSKRAALVKWLAASRRGWAENFRDPSVYPRLMHDTWLKPAGRSVEYDTFSNTAYRRLMLARGGVFAMSEDAIASNIAAINRLGRRATRNMFDTTLVTEASQA